MNQNRFVNVSCPVALVLLAGLVTACGSNSDSELVAIPSAPHTSSSSAASSSSESDEPQLVVAFNVGSEVEVTFEDTLYAVDGEYVPSEPPEVDIVPGEPGTASAENTGADCPVPTLVTPSELPAIETLPDPFRRVDGSRITERDQWRCRRQETIWQLQQYESGIKPAKPTLVSGSVSGESVTVEVSHDEQTISFDASVILPEGGSAPYPAIIGVGFATLDNDLLSDMGVAIINVNNNELGAQGGANTRGTGLFYDLYGADHSASSMIAWAWGISRLVDVLGDSETGLIDASRLGVTGCSRYGKGALLAGALDERIALTIPQESGAGGAVAWRVAQALSDDGINVQTLSSAAGEQPWFRANFGAEFGNSNVTRLPFDHHQVMGMVAPRGLLVLDNTIDWLGPVPGYVGTSAAGEIYKALGAQSNIAYSENGGHTHCEFPSHQRDLLAGFVNRFLLGEPGTTAVFRSTQADEDDVTPWIDWSTPILTESAE